MITEAMLYLRINLYYGPSPLSKAQEIGRTP